jgi:hypothetical protein
MQLTALRPIGLLLVSVYTVTIAAPALPHGCGTGPHSTPTADAGAMGHHGEHGQQSPRSEGCQCVGQSCCPAGISLVATPAIAVAIRTVPDAPVRYTETADAPPARPRHMHPPANAPPGNQ